MSFIKITIFFSFLPLNILANKYLRDSPDILPVKRGSSFLLSFLETKFWTRLVSNLKSVINMFSDEDTKIFRDQRTRFLLFVSVFRIKYIYWGVYGLVCVKKKTLMFRRFLFYSLIYINLGRYR